MKGSNTAIRSKLWARAPGWNVDQITWLLLGHDPLLAAGSDARSSDEEKRTSKQVLDVLGVVFDGTENSRRPSPAQAISLFAEVDMHFPAELVQAVREVEAEEKPNLNIPESAVTRQLKTAQKLLLALATVKFGYQPDRPNSAASQIESTVRKVGLSVSDDTVRDLLKRAYSELDQEQKRTLKRAACNP